MKKQIVLATAATLLTSSAWATKARMSALGQDTDRGSFYIKDSRSVFRNAAHINSMNNYVLTEWGDATQNTNPKAEGGFYRSAGAFAYGVYMGSEVGDQNRDVNTTGTNASYVAAEGGTAVGTHGNASFVGTSNQLDLFFGGDMGIEWGARLNYASNKQENSTTGAPEAKAGALGLGLGVVAGDLNAYINYTLNDKLEELTTATAAAAGKGAKWEDDGSMNIGVGYNWMDFAFFVDYNKEAGEYTPNGTGAKKDTTERTTLTLGAGYTKEVSSTSRMFTDIKFEKIDAEDKDGSATGGNAISEISKTSLPVTVGFEADATSWLTLRGSISQKVLINSVANNPAAATRKEVKSTDNNTTDVAAGATLNFGKLKVDGMIGTTGNDGATSAETGVLSLDRLMTRVAVHYWF